MSDSIYTNSKYTTWYYSIINSAKQHRRSKGDGVYFENHHIIPKSIGGCNNNNTILLTAKEHFICHRLLTKMTTGENKMKMYCAIWRMCNKQGNKEYNRIPSRVYEYNRKNFSENRHTHFKHSDESKRKIGLGVSGSKNGMYGRHRTSEEIQHSIKCNSIGIFKTPWGEYLTANQASNNSPIKISNISIWNLCVHRNKKQFQSIRKQMKYFNAIKGQTPHELGFDFIPKH